uniref:Uncharacterized protein n=2 Tax=Entomoneis paludosa TaxID=265537 RepID=A0A7S2Y2J3_9STRA|mmetsp:Transcript_13673/g.28247  ORF Transcript_13673/g.28247 Transcript_13673/m.28247 type:complete len:402 (+) Transcript_13673:90-1295(+)
MFKAAILALLFAEASAIRTNSKAGQKLMSKATLIEEGTRELNENNYGFIAGMKLKYTGCYNVFGLAEDGGGEDDSAIENAPVITFTLGDSCSGGGHAGKYAVNMLEFVDSYTESMMEEREWECENYRENNCYCDNADDGEYCETMCLTNAGMSDCIDDEEEEEEFEIQRYLECKEMEADNDNNNGQNGNGNYNQNQNGNGNNYYNADYPNWDGEYKIGPYCASDGKSILLGVFYDDACTVPASNGASAYRNMNYGRALPYSSESIIPVDACVDCVDKEKEAENQYNNNQNNNNYNNNQWNNMEPREFCTQAYEQSAKCEKSGGSIYYPSSTGCDFINKYLPVLSSSTPFNISSGAGGASTVFAWLFAITTIMFGAYAYFLYRKIKRGGATGLSSQDGGALA